jgi:hypothetical protein
MKQFRFLCLPLVLLFVFNSISAQTDAEKEKARLEQEKLQQTERKCVALLGEIAADADALKLTANRVAVFSTVGVLLWKYDEKQARNLVNIAAREIVNAQNSDEDSVDNQSVWQIDEARRQLVQALAPHDAEFALAIFRQTRSPEVAALMQSAKPVYPNGSDYSRVQSEINTEQALANEISRQDPKRALKLAREILEKGVTYSLMELIERIRDKEPEEASRLADEILRKFQDMDFAVSHNERNLAISFISRFAQLSELSGAEKAKFVVSESSMRALAEKIAVFFLRDPRTESYYSQIPGFIPIIEKYSPARAGQLRQRENEIKQKQGQSNPYERLNQINQDADAETLIKEAENAPSEVKSQYYTYAANKLLAGDNADRARAVINLIPDKNTRNYAVQNLMNSLFYKAIAAGNIDEARQIAAQMTNKQLQISLYIQIFNYARQKNDDKLARRILDEAASLVRTNPENSSDMTAIFELANAYASVAPETSLALIEPTVGKVNELLTASIMLNRFSNNDAAPIDEITMQTFHSAISQYGFYFNQADFIKLAMASFERTKNLGDGFQRPEARIFIRLMIAQAILSQVRADNAVYNLPVGRRWRSFAVLTTGR